MSSKRNVVIKLLKERHKSFLDVKDFKLDKNPYWHSTYPIPKSRYNEWFEYGINVISSEMNMDRKKAEVEMSWIENEYRPKIK
jgi:hypothetical protein